MKNLLTGLNESIGIRGSLVITRDGVVVAACMGEDLDRETLAALTSSVLVALKGAGPSLELGEISRFTLSAKHGRLIFEITEALVLVVITDKDIDLDITLLEIAGLAKRLQRMVKITV
jgi:predicted regulator of Ras-like GTPase activity (Roadblock/LC7/MglB family)